jgi:hypothetical protein
MRAFGSFKDLWAFSRKTMLYRRVFFLVRCGTIAAKRIPVAGKAL